MAFQTDVAVVGAGPYGLSIAAHLRVQGQSHRVFGEPMQTWRTHMPSGMWLKSDPFASNLYDPAARFTLQAYCRLHDLPYSPTDWAVPLEVFTAYGRWFQLQAAPDLDCRGVRHIEERNGGFVLTLDDDEEIVARRVVLAVGISHFARLPAGLAALPLELVSHSSAHSDPGKLSGQDVTVLGAGASALDLAMLLREAGASVRLVARARQLKFHSGGHGPRSFLQRLRRPQSGLGSGWSNFILSHMPGPFSYLPAAVRVKLVHRVLGPSAGAGVRERIEGKVPFMLGHRVVHAAPRGGRLALRLAGPESETSLETDHLICGTGYRVDISRLGFLSPALSGRISVLDGSPRLKADFQSSVPGLYFVGLAAAYQFGPLQRFAFGARYAAITVSKALA